MASDRDQLIALLQSKVLTGKNRTTAKMLREFNTELIASILNIIDDKNAVNGYAGLDANGLIVVGQIPAIITTRTMGLTGTVLDLTGLRGSVIIELTGNPTENITDIVNFAWVDQIWICPPNTMDATINDGNNIRLYAASLICYGAREGYIQLLNRAGKMYQQNYIDQYN